MQPESCGLDKSSPYEGQKTFPDLIADDLTSDTRKLESLLGVISLLFLPSFGIQAPPFLGLSSLSR